MNRQLSLFTAAPGRPLLVERRAQPRPVAAIPVVPPPPRRLLGSSISTSLGASSPHHRRGPCEAVQLCLVFDPTPAAQRLLGVAPGPKSEREAHAARLAAAPRPVPAGSSSSPPPPPEFCRVVPPWLLLANNSTGDAAVASSGAAFAVGGVEGQAC